MIKKERLSQMAACMLLCITLSVGSTCEAASLPEEVKVSSISEQVAVEAVICAEQKQKAIRNEIKQIEEVVETARISSSDQELMAAIIFCEAGNQSYEGQVAVGAVIMNRVQSPLYPNSIEEVIYQSGQFGPACTGWLDQVRSASGYTPQTFQAAADALNGADPVEGCLYFDQGGYGIQIGAHYFH